MLKRTVLLSFCVLCLACAAKAQTPPYSVSWFGNTYPGGEAITKSHPSAKWIQQNITGMTVGSDGTVYANSVYDENHRDSGIYLNGSVKDVVNTSGEYGVNTDLHGTGKWGTSGVAVDANYTYVAAMFTACGSKLAGGTPTHLGEIWQTVRRYDHTGTRAPFTSSRGYPVGGDDGTFLILSDTLATNESNFSTCPTATGPQFTYSSFGDNILAVAVNSTYLYVVVGVTTLGSPDGTQNVIHVFKTSDLSEDTSQLTTISKSNFPGVVTAAAISPIDSRLWLTVGSTGLSTGSVTPRVLVANTVAKTVADAGATGLSDPQSIAFDQAKHIMVADNGANQQIRFYDATKSPLGSTTSTFGSAGGVLKGSTPGATGNSIFQGLVGVGMDGAGNLYIAQNGVGKNTVLPTTTNPLLNPPDVKIVSGGGTPQTQIREFSPNGSTWNLTSQMEAEAYEITADIDPDSDINIYTSQRHFQFNYPSNNPFYPSWKNIALTLDYNTYPEDPRIWAVYNFPAPTMRKVSNGSSTELFQYSTSATPGQIAIWKFHGNIAVPSNFISYQSGNTGIPSNHPAAQPLSVDGNQFFPYTWSDGSNDGQFHSTDFKGYPQSTKSSGTGVNPFTSSSGHAIAWDVDSTGEVWFGITGTADSGGTIAGYTKNASIFEFRLNQSGAGNIDTNGNLNLDTWNTSRQYVLPLYNSSIADPAVIGGSYPTYFSKGDSSLTPALAATCPPKAITRSATECPGDLCSVTRISYQGGTNDVMLLAGFTANDENNGLYPACGSPNAVGATIVAYNNWKTNPTVAWKKAIQFPVWTNQTDFHFSFPASWDVAGQYIFITYTLDSVDYPSNNFSDPGIDGGQTIVLDMNNKGAQVPSMTITRGVNAANGAGTGIGAGSGLTDIPYATHAHKRPNGTYALLQEEDTDQKITVAMIPTYASDTTQYTTLSSVALSPTSASSGSSVKLTATVSNLSPVFPGAPTTPALPPTPPVAAGTVTFYDGSTSLGTATLSNGTASLSTTALTATGIHSITFKYTPSDSHLLSWSPAAQETITP
jgi:hypothetical protein